MASNTNDKFFTLLDNQINPQSNSHIREDNREYRNPVREAVKPSKKDDQSNSYKSR